MYKRKRVDELRLIGKQLYLCDGQIRQEVMPVCNSEESAFIKKPKQETGLWTSSWREETRDSEWVEWCIGEAFGEPLKQSWWVLTPRHQSRLYVIDGVEDLLALLDAFSWETEKLRALNAEFEVMPRWMYEDLSRQEVARFSSLLQKHYAYIDFERLAGEYDGIWLTEQGNVATHLSYPHNLNGWDVESTLWFRWCFSDVEQVRVEVPMKLDGERGRK